MARAWSGGMENSQKISEEDGHHHIAGRAHTRRPEVGARRQTLPLGATEMCA